MNLLPSLAVARDLTNIIGSYFYGRIGSYFSNLRISVDIQVRDDRYRSLRGPHEKGNPFQEGHAAPYLVCSYDPRTDPTDCGVVEALPLE